MSNLKAGPKPIATFAVLVALVTALIAIAVPAAAGAAPPTACKNRTNTTYQTLLECVTLEGVRAHQQAFQDIADANDDEFYPGTRAAGTKGYAESVEYVAGLLEDAGYNVTLDPFEFTFDFPVTIDQLTPVAASYPSGAFTGSGFGETTAAVTAVDVNLVPPRANTSGCEAADFAGFVAGNIALVQRGTCTFADKATNAQAAGASAVIIFNQGNDPTREGLIVGTLAPFTATITAATKAHAAGEYVQGSGNPTGQRPTFQFNPSSWLTQFTGYLDLAQRLSVNGTQVVNARHTGWGAPTGTPTRTTFATGSVTLPELAERVKALIDDLTDHGLIGS